MNQDEIKNAINAIQEFIHLIVNGLEIVQDDQGISSVRIIDHESKKLVRELEPEELLAVVDNCKTLMSLTQRTL
ncbi:MAG: FlaG protein [Cyanobacteriota bacterium]